MRDLSGADGGVRIRRLASPAIGPALRDAREVLVDRDERTPAYAHMPRMPSVRATCHRRRTGRSRLDTCAAADWERAAGYLAVPPERAERPAMRLDPRASRPHMDHARSRGMSHAPGS
jgi:hypothetical protein